MTWYAVMTNARAELLAAAELCRQGYEVLYLHYPGTVSHARRVSRVLRPYFPRYLFARVEATQSVYGVNHTQGVSTVVYAGDEPVEVPEKVIEELRTRGDENGLVKMTPDEEEVRKRYETGAQVEILTGPFAGFLGVVELDKGKEVCIFLETFKRRVRFGLMPEQVSPVVRRHAR